MIKSNYTFECDCCGKSIENISKTLPYLWTQGQVVITNGVATSPYFHLCETCWYDPIKANKPSWRITLKKLLANWKFK